MNKKDKILWIVALIITLVFLAIGLGTRGFVAENANLLRIAGIVEYFAYISLGFLLMFMGKKYLLVLLSLIPFIFFEHWVFRKMGVEFIAQTISDSFFLYDFVCVSLAIGLALLGSLVAYLMISEDKKNEK